MKKSILLISVAALAFGACNNNDKTYELNGDEKVIDVKAISGSELEAGMYIYTLAIGGVEVDSKRMILNNQ